MHHPPRKLRGTNNMGNETIGSIVRSKRDSVHFVAPTATVFEAIAMMAEKDIAAVLVMRAGTLLGIISAKDYGRKVVLKGRSSKDVLVQEIMTTPVFTTTLDRTVGGDLAVMTCESIRHLPVLADGETVGIVSMADLVKSLVSEQAFVIEELRKYVGHQ
jgi:CBS domain-containing protein